MVGYLGVLYVRCILTQNMQEFSKVGHQLLIQDFTYEGVPAPQEGAPSYYLAKYLLALHENERNWTEGEGGVSRGFPWIRQCRPRLYLQNLLK